MPIGRGILVVSMLRHHAAAAEAPMLLEKNTSIILHVWTMYNVWNCTRWVPTMAMCIDLYKVILSCTLVSHGYDQDQFLDVKLSLSILILKMVRNKNTKYIRKLQSSLL